ncbi:MAG: AAA family ATPase [Verrucomicrobiota bacterium]|jgi:predicted ATPase
MLSTIHIKNFKSIRDLEFSAKRVNVFIGEPNTGKSNVIEALALHAARTFLPSLNEVLRFGTTADLFFDQMIAGGLEVQAGDRRLLVRFTGERYLADEGQDGRQGTFLIDHSGTVVTPSQLHAPTSIRYYLFRPLTVFPNRQPGVLNPPFGDNLVAVLCTNEALRQRVGGVIRSKGFRLQLRPAEDELFIAKDVKEELYSYPWIGVSETLRRVAFLMAVLETNRDATLLLDEPESSIWPFYTKYFAERMGLDESNQYFITTHNPYLLSSIVEKTPMKDLNVFVTTMEQFETRLKRVPDENLPELLELDSAAFFNLDRLAAE